MAYVTTAEVKDALGIVDTNDDTVVDLAVETVTEVIDNWVNRSGGTAGVFEPDASASARTFHADDRVTVEVDDFHTTTGLVVETDDDDDGSFETTWSSDDYQVEPVNPKQGRPYTRIVAVDSETFPIVGRRARVQITAQWGWASVPKPVKNAALLQAQRWVKRVKDAPFGVAPLAGFDGAGIRLMNKLDPDVEVMVSPYSRLAGM